MFLFDQQKEINIDECHEGVTINIIKGEIKKFYLFNMTMKTKKIKITQNEFVPKIETIIERDEIKPGESIKLLIKNLTNLKSSISINDFKLKINERNIKIEKNRGKIIFNVDKSIEIENNNDENIYDLYSYIIDKDYKLIINDLNSTNIKYDICEKNYSK